MRSAVAILSGVAAAVLTGLSLAVLGGGLHGGTGWVSLIAGIAVGGVAFVMTPDPLARAP